MIQTLDDLVALTEREAEAEPLIADSIRLGTPGSTADEIVQIREAFPTIPESYVDVVQRIRLLDVQILAFTPAPGWSPDGPLVERLKKWNRRDLGYADFLRERQLIRVGDFYDALICVRQNEPEFSELPSDRGQVENFRPGEVILVDLVRGGPKARRLTWSYAQTLLGFGRLEELRLARRFGARPIAEFLDAMRVDFRLDDDQLDLWGEIAWAKIGEDLDATESQPDAGTSQPP